MKYIKTTALLLLLFSPGIAVAKTQKKPGYLKKKAKIIFVGKKKKGRSYPLVVFMPFTTGSAQNYYNSVKHLQPFKNYVAVIPEGTISQNDYLPDFWSYVEWYEKRLLKDIKRARKKFKVNKKKIYMQGFSLGGDLSWAFMIRQKELFRGAYIIGSRCSYPINNDDLKFMKKNDRRFVLAIGKHELPARKKGIRIAQKKLKKGGVRKRYREFLGQHAVPPEAVQRKTLRWLVKGK